MHLETRIKCHREQNISAHVCVRDYLGSLENSGWCPWKTPLGHVGRRLTYRSVDKWNFRGKDTCRQFGTFSPSVSVTGFGVSVQVERRLIDLHDNIVHEMTVKR